MKKLIAVLVLFVLLAAAAFAEVGAGVEIKGSWYVLEGTNKDDKKNDFARPLGNDLAPRPWTGSNWAGDGHNIRGRATVTAVNEEETLGGWLEVQALPGPAGRGNVWWQPATPFKATMGYIWGDANMVGDIVTVDDDLLPVQYFGRYNAERDTEWTSRVIHGWGWESEDAAATIELRPVEGLYFIATVPLVQQGTFLLGSDVPAGDVFAQTAARIAYTIGDIAQFAINWDGGTMTQFKYSNEDKGALVEAYDPAFIGAHFNLLAVENLAMSVGFEFPLPISKYHRDFGSTDPDAKKSEHPEKLEKAYGKFKRQYPIGLDLRANFTASDFNIGFGFAAYLAGYTDTQQKSEKTKKWINKMKREKDDFEFGVTLNPSYAFSALTVGVVGEVGFVASKDDDVKDSKNAVSYSVIPYVKKDLGPGSVYAGVQVNGSNAYDIHWAIPIGFVVSF